MKKSTRHESGFLEAPLVRQADGELKNTWNVRRLIDESFVPSAQRTSVLYCRLSDLWWGNKLCFQTNIPWKSCIILKHQVPKISFHPYNYAVSSDVSLYILLLCLLEVPIFNKTRMECKKFLPFFYFFFFSRSFLREAQLY